MELLGISSGVRYTMKRLETLMVPWIKSLKLSDLWENKKNTYLEKEGGKNPLATVYRLSNWTNMQKPIIVN